MLDIVLHAVLQDKKHVKALVIQIRHFLLRSLLPLYPPYTFFSLSISCLLLRLPSFYAPPLIKT